MERTSRGAVSRFRAVSLGHVTCGDRRGGTPMRRRSDLALIAAAALLTGSAAHAGVLRILAHAEQGSRVEVAAQQVFVAGARFARVSLPVPIPLPIAGELRRPLQAGAWAAAEPRESGAAGYP